MAVLFCFTNGEVIEAVKRRWQRWRLRIAPASRLRRTTRSRSASSMRHDRPSTLVVFSGGSSGCRTPTTIVAGGGLGGQNRAPSCEHIATLTPNGLSADMSSHGIPIPLRNNSTSAASGSSRGSVVSAGSGSVRKNGSISAKATKTNTKENGKSKSPSNSQSKKSESKHCTPTPNNGVGRPPSPSSCCLLGNGVRAGGTPSPPMARDKDKSKCGEAIEEIHIVIEAQADQPSNGSCVTKSLDLNPL